MTTGGAAMTLPLALDARDPISALFYVRTLPLAPGAHVFVSAHRQRLATRIESTSARLKRSCWTGAPGRRGSSSRG